MEFPEAFPSGVVGRKGFRGEAVEDDLLRVGDQVFRVQVKMVAENCGTGVA